MTNDTDAAYQPNSEELLQAVRQARACNPDYGVKRIWLLMKEKNWIVSEQRVKKIMQEIGLVESPSMTISSKSIEESIDGTLLCAMIDVSFID
jgi:hypothetical protein